MKIKNSVHSTKMEVGNWQIPENSSIHEMKERGSTEIISKYNNYQITEIVTDIRRNEVIDISKITKEALENIIGGYVVRLKRQEVPEKTDNCTSDTSQNLGDSTKFKDIQTSCSQNSTESSNRTGNYTGGCYVRIEVNQVIENLQNKRKKIAEGLRSKSRRHQSRLICNEGIKLISNKESDEEDSKSLSDLVRAARKIECVNHKQVFKSMKMKKFCTKECYVNLKIDKEIQNMQNKFKKISETHNGNKSRNIYKILGKKCNTNSENQKLTKRGTEDYSALYTTNKGMRKKKFREDMNCENNLHSRCAYSNSKMENKREPSPRSFNSFFPSNKVIKKVLKDMCQYKKENDILICENLRIENSLIKARRRIKLLETELNNFERINNYTFLKKYFQEDEIIALLRNCKIDWCNKMITKALQLRFACGNEGYEKLSKSAHLPCLKTLRNRVHDSKFDLALLARDMINF